MRQKRIRIATCWLGVLAAAAAAPPGDAGAKLPKPGQAIVMETARGWTLTDWGYGTGYPLCSRPRLEPLKGGGMRFVVPEAGAMRTWLHRPALPISPQRYPIIVVRYRATNLDAAGWWYGLWVRCDLLHERKGLIVLDMHQIRADGKVHEFHRDVRDYWLGPPQGAITNLAVGVLAGKKAPASLELLELRFEAAPDADAQPLTDDPKLTVEAVGPDDRPLVGATVIVDGERRNFARRGQTGAAGRVVLTPLSNEVGQHRIRVEMPGRVPAELTVTAGQMTKPARLRLVPGVRYGGVVRDAKGQPIGGVLVAGHTVGKDGKPSTEAAFHALTDVKGRWTFPVLPTDSPALPIRLSHPDYVDDAVADAWRKPPVEQSRKQTAVLTMRRGAPLTGRVVDEQERPIAGVVVRAGRNPWSQQMVLKRSDAQGRFAFTHLPAGGTWMMVAHADGYAMEMIRLGEGAEPMPQVFRMRKAPPLRLRFVDPDGNPVHGAYVRIGRWFDVDRSPLRGQSGVDGRLVWPSVPATEVEFQVIAEGYMPRHGLEFPDRSKEHVIELRPWRLQRP